jgi:uncharacterized membrane protein
MILLLSPMSLYLFGSVAPDGFLITGSFLLVALALKYGTADGQRISAGVGVAVIALAASIAISKGVYLPVTLAAGVLLFFRLPSARSKMAWVAAFIIFCVLPVWWWSHVVATVYYPGRTDIPIDPVAQAQFIRTSPLTFLKVVATSLQVEYVGIYHWFVGVLSWGDTMMPMWFYWTYGCGLMLCVIAESPGAVVVRWWQRTLLFGAACAAALLIIIAQYLIWNAPGSLGPIESLQGRYFIPVAILAVASFPAIARLRVSASMLAFFASGLGCVSAVVCLVAVVKRFYIE